MRLTSLTVLSSYGPGVVDGQSGGRIKGSCIDLLLNREVTAALLGAPLEWRVRVVEQIDVDSPTGTHRRRSLQTQPLRPVIAAAVGVSDAQAASVATHALLALPVAPVSKGPLLDFDVYGPAGESALLLPRAEIAARQVLLLAAQAEEAGVPITAAAAMVAEQAFAFTDAPWRQFRPDLHAYLLAGTEPDAEPQVAEWERLADAAGSVLAPYADTPSADSAVECPALVVPALLAEGLVNGPAAATQALQEYADLCLAAVAAARDDGNPERAGSALVFLNTLVDYGTHYDLMAIMKVPLDEPFLVKTSDRRSLSLSIGRNEGRQSLVIADAQSNHVALRVIDPNARLAGTPRADHPAGGRAYGLFAATQSAQVHSFYASDPDRDYRILLVFQVASLKRLQGVPYAIAAALVVLSLLVLVEDPGDRELALLVTPAALAATILLSREPSALGSRLRLVSTYALGAATALLVFVGALLYLSG